MSTPRRAGDAAAAFTRAGIRSRPAATPAASISPVQTPATAAAGAVSADDGGDGGGKPRQSKYTMLLDPEEALVFDQLALTVRAQLGYKIDKSLIVKVLLSLTADDPTMLASLVDEVRHRECR